MKKTIALLLVMMISSSFSYATPLDEMISDVEVSGTVRFRYENQRVKGNMKKNPKRNSNVRTEVTIK